MPGGAPTCLVRPSTRRPKLAYSRISKPLARARGWGLHTRTFSRFCGAGPLTRGRPPGRPCLGAEGPDPGVRRAPLWSRAGVRPTWDTVGQVFDLPCGLFPFNPVQPEARLNRDREGAYPKAETLSPLYSWRC